MGPRSRAAIERRWEADERFQRHILEELRAQRGVQGHILAEIRRLAGLLITGLGQTNATIASLEADVAAVAEQAGEHERKLSSR